MVVNGTSRCRIRHKQIQGRSYDMTEIFESCWKLARMTYWNVVKTQTGDEHKALVVSTEAEAPPKTT
ncbi:unnamed protein product [Heligmosomoides polygyrus]|uniref:Tyrosine-protein phosphatase domain-containing protein n=1 Tax=Heligmosomoides polygyrus TaxID=6339 RepID=A0A183GVX0_HELPZ|nr:unnamed protein product [Heligmosomoides polygyrus]